MDATQTRSPFLHPGTSAEAASLAVLHLRRDQLLPVVLEDAQAQDGYKEGVVTNTRFGSYPHSTITDQPWGTQVLASQVDTGTRGRKRKRGPDEDGKATDSTKLTNGSVKEELDDDKSRGSPTSKAPRTAVTASTGFCHVLPPTPEIWTQSLPHRTQVVYTPDYSYILQKIRARPGSVIIEAGAGSGSFTHAAARAAFNGYCRPGDCCSRDQGSSQGSSQCGHGKLYSFEYHEPRAQQLQAEIETHGLSPTVKVTNRDVYNEGFRVRHNTDGSLSSPRATQVFLDLPAPWKSLPHLTRSSDGPLNPEQAVHLCIFLPCIEQVQRAMTALRAHGWIEINMQEIQHRRIEVRRERVGLELEGLRNVNATPQNVEEAVARLLEVEKSGRRYQTVMTEKGKGATAQRVKKEEDADDLEPKRRKVPHQTSRADRLARNVEHAASRKTFMDGRLVHRTEPEIRTHTSYLIFAVLPREWTAEDEARCMRRWPIPKSEEELP